MLLAAAVLFTVWVAACDMTNPTSYNPPSNGGVQAIIGLNDHVTANWDSLLINVPYKVSSALSTGNIVRREWRVYRWRTGQLLFTDTATFFDSTQTSVDTLIFKLKVFGSASNDTSSATLNIRFLSQMGVGSSGDIQLLSFVPPNTYYLFFPASRFPSPPPHNDPKSIVFTETGTLQISPLTDAVPGGWRYTIQRNSHDTLKFNYSYGANVWSLSSGSIFKSPGNDNAYTIRFINGYIYNWNGGPPFTVPGVNGDTVARYDATTTHLIIYPNHRWIMSQPIGQTWHEVNAWDFERKSHSEYGQTGYGVINVPIDSIQRRSNQVAFRFGGNTVADMTHSQLYSNGYIRFQFIGPTFGPLIAGQEVELLFENGTRIRLSVRVARTP